MQFQHRGNDLLLHRSRQFRIHRQRQYLSGCLFRMGELSGLVAEILTGRQQMARRRIVNSGVYATSLQRGLQSFAIR